jgi:dihydroflavonol-4-reductase
MSRGLTRLAPRPQDMRPLFKPKRILITGATGRVGRALSPSLAGFQVPIRILQYRAATAGVFARREVVRGDLARPETLRGAADGCDVVVHAAARAGFAIQDRDEQRRINVAGTEALLAEAQSSGVRLFVLIGYTGTVQEREDVSRPVDEETPPESRYESDYVRMKFEAEAMVLEANRAGGMATIVVSPGVLAQPGASTILGGLVKAFVSRELPFRFLEDVWLAMTDGNDLGRCVASAIEAGHGGRRYFATGDCLRLGEVYRLLTELSGVAAPRRSVPDLLVEEMGLLTPVLPRHSFLRRLVLPRQLVRHLKQLAPVENARTRAELGFEPTPFRTTLKAMIEEG